MKLQSLSHSLSAFATAAAFFVAPAFAGQLSKDLANVPSGTSVDVIVQFKAKPTKAMLGKVTAKGGTMLKQFANVPAAAFKLNGASLADVGPNTDIAYVSPDREVKGSLDYANPALNAPLAFSSGWLGTNIGIAVIDSGVNSSHPDLIGRVVANENFVPLSTSTADTFGHGTHVALIAAGNATASLGANSTRTFRGIAPGAKIVNLRVLNGLGFGTDSSVIAAIDRAIALKTTHNIKVINLSLGRFIYESYALDPLCKAVEAAYKAGIVVVVAAGNGGRDNWSGNQGYGSIGSPGNDPYVITVGALRDLPPPAPTMLSPPTVRRDPLPSITS